MLPPVIPSEAPAALKLTCATCQGDASGEGAVLVFTTATDPTRYCSDGCAPRAVRPCIPPPGAPGGPDFTLCVAIARWVADVDARPASVAQGQRHNHRPSPRGVSHALTLYLAAPTRAAALALGNKLAGWAADFEDMDGELDVDAFRAASVRALELSLQVTPAPSGSDAGRSQGDA
jgi:hypothetical protein